MAKTRGYQPMGYENAFFLHGRNKFVVHGIPPQQGIRIKTMPSSGEPTRKRKRSDASLSPSRRNRPDHKKKSKNKIGGPLKWFLRSRKNKTEKINDPSTSSIKERIARKVTKRKTADEVNNVESKIKQPRQSKEVNESIHTETSISEIEEQIKSTNITETERSEKTAGAAGDENHDQHEEDAGEKKEVTENTTLKSEEEDAILEFNKIIQENEKFSEEIIVDEKNETKRENRDSSITQESSSKENYASDIPGSQASVSSLSVSEKNETPHKREEKPKESIMQRNPCLGSCDEAEQHHWQVRKGLRMETEEDQCCKSSGCVLAGVGLSENAVPPINSLQEEEEWTDEHLMALLENPQCAQPPFPITLNEMDLMELERLLDLYEENN